MQALVVDDARAMRCILKGILESSGFTVVEAENGTEALTKLAEHPSCELACIDYNMPNLKGDEVVRQIRENTEHDAMKIVIITTESDRAMVNKFFELGANEYVFKPFEKAAIVAKLQSLGLVE